MSAVLRWQTVKTRKPYKCPLCNREIPAKSNMVVAAWADGGHAYSERFCEVCEEYWHSALGNEEICFDGDPIYGDDFETWEAMRVKLEGI